MKIIMVTDIVIDIHFCIVMVSDLICAKYCHSEQYLLSDNHSYSYHRIKQHVKCHGIFFKELQEHL